MLTVTSVPFVFMMCAAIGISSCTLQLLKVNDSDEELSASSHDQCPPWSYYNSDYQQCECYDNVVENRAAGLLYIVRCAKGKTSLGYNYCMTYNEESGILSAGYCPYFILRGYKVSEPGLIDLPTNISELNEYMCGPMNRKGFMCSECIDGYGPSLTSPKFQCSHCMSILYGVSLYLLLEVVPVTVFYVIVLLFQLNLTKPPIPVLVFYSNIIYIRINFYMVNLNEAQTYRRVIALLYGIWSLDFFRYAVPPFCISPTLKVKHIIYLQSVSIILPYILIAITWVLINLHSRDNKCVVWIWTKFDNMILKHLNIKRNSNRTVVDTFATFFLLSFAKVTFLIALPLFSQSIHYVNDFNQSRGIAYPPFINPSVNYASGSHLPIVVSCIGIFVFLILPPALILAFYPIRAFRTVLSKSCRRQYLCTLNFYVEKFYSFYQDGLDGGKDLRSFASLYFFLFLLSFVAWFVNIFFVTILFGACSIIIATVRPYKEEYMSIVDSLILANVALVTTGIDRNIYASRPFQVLYEVIAILPAFGLIMFICVRLLRKSIKFTKADRIFKENITSWFCRWQEARESQEVQQDGGSNSTTNLELQLPDRVENPNNYEETNYATY